MRADVQSFSEIVEEFTARAHRMVWCNVATIDSHGRPRSRVLHPFWADGIGWIATTRDSPKGAHLARNPHVSLAYIADILNPVYADCTAAWADSDADKHYVWDFFKAAPEPLGYDPGMIWKSVDDPKFGVLKLTPWRIELSTIPSPPGVIKVWRSEDGV
jgi:general stress protein 26